MRLSSALSCHIGTQHCCQQHFSTLDSNTIASRDPAERGKEKRKQEDKRQKRRRREEEEGDGEVQKEEGEGREGLEKNLAAGRPFTENTKSQCQLELKDRKQN